MTRKAVIGHLIALQNKNFQHLSALYEEYFYKLQALAMTFVKNKSDAYDIAMEVLLKLSGENYEPRKIVNVDAWLITLTKNTAIDFLRKNKRIVPLEYSEEIPARDTVYDRLDLEELLSVLTPEEKKLAVEHGLWGVPLINLAKEMEKPYITVKRMYAKIKRKLDAFW